MKIYLAGPLYSTAEREFNVRLAAALKANGHIVWLPQKRPKRRWTARKIFKKDVEGIDTGRRRRRQYGRPRPELRHRVGMRLRLWQETRVASENYIRAYRWCRPPRIG